MTKITTKFILSKGKHFYVEVPKRLLDEFKEVSSKHKFFTVEGHKFEYVGLEEEKIPVFKEADVVEIKVAKLALKVAKFNYKVAQALLDQIAHADLVDEFIKKIGVKKDSDLIQKIKKIKDKGQLYPKDEALIKVYWWQAKRDAFREQLAKANVELPIDERAKERSFTLKVLDDLNSKLTKAIRDYKSFPEE